MLIHSPYMTPKDGYLTIVTHNFTCFHNNMNLVSCKCQPIERVSCVTYLGMKIDENFSWSTHTDFICNKLRILLGQFYQLSFKVPISTLKCLYNALVDSILSYGLDCYGLTFKTNINKLESLQIRFLKLLVSEKIKNSCKNDYKKLFKICKILPVGTKVKYLLAVNSHGSQKNLQLVEHKHSTRTISNGKYVVPRVSNYTTEIGHLKNEYLIYLTRYPRILSLNQKRTYSKTNSSDTC